MLKRLRQGDHHKVEAKLGYSVRSCLRKKEKEKKRKADRKEGKKKRKRRKEG